MKNASSSEVIETDLTPKSSKVENWHIPALHTQFKTEFHLRILNLPDITEKDITEGFEEAKKSSQDLSEKNGKLQLEVWINKKMKRPTRMGVSGGDKSVSVSFFANPQFDHCHTDPLL